MSLFKRRSRAVAPEKPKAVESVKLRIDSVEPWTPGNWWYSGMHHAGELEGSRYHLGISQNDEGTLYLCDTGRHIRAAVNAGKVPVVFYEGNDDRSAFEKRKGFRLSSSHGPSVQKLPLLTDEFLLALIAESEVKSPEMWSEALEKSRKYRLGDLRAAVNAGVTVWGVVTVLTTCLTLAWVGVFDLL